MAWLNNYIDGSIRKAVIDRLFPTGTPTPSVLGTDYDTITEWRADIGDSEGVLKVPNGYEHEEHLTASIPRLRYNQILLTENPFNKGKIHFIFDQDTSGGNAPLGTGNYGDSASGAIMDIEVSVDGGGFDSDMQAFFGSGGYLIGNIVSGVKNIADSSRFTVGFWLQSDGVVFINNAVIDTKEWRGGDYTFGLFATTENAAHVIRNYTCTAAIKKAAVADQGKFDIYNARVHNYTEHGIVGTSEIGLGDGSWDKIVTCIDTLTPDISIDSDGYSLLESDGNGSNFSDDYYVVVDEISNPSGLSNPIKVEFYDDDTGILLYEEEDLYDGDHVVAVLSPASFPTLNYYQRIYEWDSETEDYVFAMETGVTTVSSNKGYTDDINGEAFTADAWDRGADAYIEAPAVSLVFRRGCSNRAGKYLSKKICSGASGRLGKFISTRINK